MRELLRRFAARDDVELTLLVDALLPGLERGRFRALLGGGRFRLARRVPPDCDVVWHPWNGTFFDDAGLPAVATIHDAVPFAYPDPDERKRASQQGPFERSARRSAAILTDSAFSAGEIARRLGVPPGRIRVVPLAAGPEFRPGPPGAAASGAYVLAVGSDESHKNVGTLAQGAREALERRGVRLAALGARLPPEGPFETLGPLDEAGLLAAYRGAVLLAAPSLYEGFGLPALEAMAAGTPVLAARAGPYPEVCGEAAAYVDEPADPAAWGRALASLLDDGERRAALRAAGMRRAAQFTWERTASQTLAVLRAHARPDGTRADASAVHN